MTTDAQNSPAKQEDSIDAGSPGAAVLRTILSRQSPRSFAAEDVPAEVLRKLFEAARWAASSYNEQPWRFIVGKRGDAAYQKILDTLVEFNQTWARLAPILTLSLASRRFAHNGTENRYSLHDTGAATAYLTLQAFALGLRTHSMGGFDYEKARQTFSIPDDYEIGAVTAIGYPGDPSSLPESVRAMEGAPRQRKPLEDITLSAWGTSFKF